MITLTLVIFGMIGIADFFLTIEAKSLSLVQFYFSLAHNGYAHLYLDS